MKVNFSEKVTGVTISRLSVGDTFLADRKSSNEVGLYIKVDKSSGLACVGNNYCLAVNLQSGQLRKFIGNAVVTPTETEVNFVKDKRA